MAFNYSLAASSLPWSYFLLWHEFVDLGPWHSYNFVTFLVHDEVYIVCEHMYSYFHISSTRFRDRDVNGESRDKIPQGYEDKGTSV